MCLYLVTQKLHIIIFHLNYSETNVIFNCDFLSYCYVLKIFGVNVYVCVFRNLLVANCVCSRTMFF